MIRGFSLIRPFLAFGMHQYWRDFDTLEAWSRSTPHRASMPDLQ